MLRRHLRYDSVFLLIGFLLELDFGGSVGRNSFWSHGKICVFTTISGKRTDCGFQTFLSIIPTNGKWSLAIRIFKLLSIPQIFTLKLAYYTLKKSIHRNWSTYSLNVSWSISNNSSISRAIRVCWEKNLICMHFDIFYDILPDWLILVTFLIDLQYF